MLALTAACTRSFDRPPEISFATAATGLSRQLTHAADLLPLAQDAASARFVLLGESSHGTAEYYVWRAKLSKQLITQHGFSFVAVEGDWPYLAAVNRYVKGYEGAAATAKAALLSPRRWPEWLWANVEFLEFVEWLQQYNQQRPLEKRVGIYGIDMQDKAASMAAAYRIAAFNPELGATIRKHYACLEPFGGDMMAYARAHARLGISCKPAVRGAIAALQSAYPRDQWLSVPALRDIKQNMRAVSAGERYARAMVRDNASVWNERVHFMAGTIAHLTEVYAHVHRSVAASKGIIWAHNTHVGDARATEMAKRGEVNLGQILRETHGGDAVFILGFSTYRGTVIGGRRWGGEQQVLNIPEPPIGTMEHHLGQIGMDAFVLRFSRADYPDVLLQPYGHRAKGVVYHPESEQRGNYIATVLPQRYDALVFIRETTPLRPL